MVHELRVRRCVMLQPTPMSRDAASEASSPVATSARGPEI
jgi:hypothetical protein